QPIDRRRSRHRILGRSTPNLKGEWRERTDQFCNVDQGIYGHLTLRNLAVLAEELPARQRRPDALRVSPEGPKLCRQSRSEKETALRDRLDRGPFWSWRIAPLRPVSSPRRWRGCEPSRYQPPVPAGTVRRPGPTRLRTG